MKIINVVSLCLILILGGAPIVLAQQQSGKINIQKPTVAPNAQDASRVFSQPRLRVTQLNQVDKLRVINESLKRQGLPTVNGLTPGASITLAMPNAASGGETYLSFFKPHVINFATNVTQFTASANWAEGSLWVHFKPAAPGKYLLDFTVDNDSMLGNGTIEYTLLGLDNSLKQTLQMPGLHEHKISHVTFVVEVADTQKKGFVLYSGYGWTFYQCEITPFK